MNELFTKKDLKLISIIEFQCIYIKSSYLIGGYFSDKCKLNEMNYKLEQQKNEINDLKKLVSNLKEEINSLKEANKANEKKNEAKDKIDNKNIDENNQVNNIMVKQKEETKNDIIESKTGLGNKQ